MTVSPISSGNIKICEESRSLLVTLPKQLTNALSRSPSSSPEYPSGHTPPLPSPGSPNGTRSSPPYPSPSLVVPVPHSIHLFEWPHNSPPPHKKTPNHQRWVSSYLKKGKERRLTLLVEGQEVSDLAEDGPFFFNGEGEWGREGEGRRRALSPVLFKNKEENACHPKENESGFFLARYLKAMQK